MSSLLRGLTGLTGLVGSVGSGAGAGGVGGSSLAASHAALGMLDKSSALASLRLGGAEALKLQDDVDNAIVSGYLDSSGKAMNTMIQSVKAITY